MAWVRSVIVVAMVAILAGACAGDVTEEGRYSVTVINQHEHVFAAGEVSFGLLLMVGGRVVVEEGADHRGPIYVLAGDLQVEGTVDGSVTVLGGDVELGGESVVTGDLHVAGGSFAVSPTARIEGQTIEDNLTQLIDTAPRRTLADWLVWFVATIAGMAGLAGLTTRAAPRLTWRVAEAGTRFPVVSGALGLLALIVIPALVASMIFTLFLIPLALIVGAVLGLVVAYGLLTLGRGIGDWIVPEWSPPRAAAVGAAALIGSLHLVSLIPLLGVLVIGLTLAVATGAVFLTGFGTRTYRPPSDDFEDAQAR